MIRRRSGFTLQLITQTDHAAVSGFLAEHLGNDLFARPTADVIAAIHAHDAGWPLHDDQPMLNASGWPLHVFETPPSLSTQIWSASVERAAVLGPYAALLVSLHQLNLSDGVIRRGLEAKSGGGNFSPRDVFDLNKFQHRQIELQETLRMQIGLRTDIPLTLGLAKRGIDEAEDRLRCDFRWLVLCDSLSLELCCGKPLFSMIRDILPSPLAATPRNGPAITSATESGATGRGTPRPVAFGKPTSTGLGVPRPVAPNASENLEVICAPLLNIQIERVNDETLVLNPWPFDAPNISTDVPFRRLPDSPFPDTETFQTALRNAPVETLRLELRAGG